MFLQKRLAYKSYLEDSWGNQFSVDRSSAWEAVKVEPEESLLLWAFARERLLKTRQAGKSLVAVVMICELWRLAVAL
jgi:hypothetical protein